MDNGAQNADGHVNANATKILPSTVGLSSAAQKISYAAMERKIKKLPQELQDLCFNFLLIAEQPREKEIVVMVVRAGYTYSPVLLNDVKSPTETSVVHVARSVYHLPLALQLNKEIREQFAKKYYSNITFYVQDDHVHKGRLSKEGGEKRLEIGYLWLSSLTKEHRDLVTTIKYAGMLDDEGWRDYAPYTGCIVDLRRFTLEYERASDPLTERNDGQHESIFRGAEKIVWLLEHSVPRWSTNFDCAWYRGDGSWHSKQGKVARCGVCCKS